MDFGPTCAWDTLRDHPKPFSVSLFFFRWFETALTKLLQCRYSTATVQCHLRYSTCKIVLSFFFRVDQNQKPGLEVCLVLVLEKLWCSKCAVLTLLTLLL